MYNRPRNERGHQKKGQKYVIVVELQITAASRQISLKEMVNGEKP